MPLNKRTHLRLQAGFTLVELLVTMLIVTVGLLGLAKMQAAAVANTALSRTRALMTYQAESLAGMMRANQDFWVTSGAHTTWPGFSLNSAGAVTVAGMPSAAKSCINAVPVCSADQLARDDIYTWASQFNDGTASSSFQGAQASIVCVSATGGSCATNPTTPHSYDLTLKWDQKVVAVNRSTVNSTPQSLTMVMHIQP